MKTAERSPDNVANTMRKGEIARNCPQSISKRPHIETRENKVLFERERVTYISVNIAQYRTV